VETHARSIAKAVSWRIGGFLVTFVVSWIVTRRLGVAVSLSLADTLVKLGAYYAHERLWLKVRFGRSRAPDYDI
jgi:adenylylsulfate kinase